MRDAFCRSLVALAGNPNFMFLTGDLGFKALEPLRDAMGSRFINAGVAEQNMVSVAAGLAHSGLRPWVYSIAPFIYARPFEQIRNDVCLHDVRVVMVGNGGGYGYGVMGATHHAIEDYGALGCLPNVRSIIPAFDGDLPDIAALLLGSFSHPAYLRLGLSEQPADMPMPAFSPWRKVLAGAGQTVVVIGPLVGGIVDAARALPELQRPNVWLLGQLPIEQFPEHFLHDLRRSQRLMVVEEHVAAGGAGQAIAHRLVEAGIAPRQFSHHRALGYVSGLYGSQKFHRRESGLDVQSIMDELTGRSSFPNPLPGGLGERSAA